MNYFFALVKTVTGAQGVPTLVPDIDPADAGLTWAGNWSTASVPGYPNGTMVFGIEMPVALSNPNWPGVSAATQGNFQSWRVRTGDSTGASDHWLGQ